MDTQLVKKIVTKFAVAKKKSGREGNVYRSPRIYLPTKLTDDSRFPLREDDLISIRVDGRRIIVQRASKAQIIEESSAEKVRKS